MTTTTCDKHDWMVVDTALKTVSLIVRCSECGVCGRVDDPSQEEWERAFHAPNRPYRWEEDEQSLIKDVNHER